MPTRLVHPLTRSLAHPPPPPPTRPHTRSPTRPVAAFAVRQRGSCRRRAIGTQTGVAVVGGEGTCLPAWMLPARHHRVCLLGINSASATAGARVDMRPSLPLLPGRASPSLAAPSLVCRTLGFLTRPSSVGLLARALHLRCECRTVPSVLGAAAALSSALRSCTQPSFLWPSPASLSVAATSLPLMAAGSRGSMARGGRPC